MDRLLVLEETAFSARHVHADGQEVSVLGHHLQDVEHEAVDGGVALRAAQNLPASLHHCLDDDGSGERLSCSRRSLDEQEELVGEGGLYCVQLLGVAVPPRLRRLQNRLEVLLCRTFEAFRNRHEILYGSDLSTQSSQLDALAVGVRGVLEGPERIGSRFDRTIILFLEQIQLDAAR